MNPDPLTVLHLEEPLSDKEWREFMGAMDRNEDGTRKAERVSRRTLYLAIGSGFLLGIGVGWMVRRA